MIAASFNGALGHLGLLLMLAASIVGALSTASAIIVGNRRGVRQAPVRVLMGATMPSILVEVGFISNPDEESQLRGEVYRTRVAQAMAAAVHDFLSDLELLSRPTYSGAPGAGRP